LTIVPAPTRLRTILGKLELNLHCRATLGKDSAMFLIADTSGNLPTEFFTRDSIFTFTGITGATFVIANGIQKAANWNPRWLALVLAILLCVLGVYVRGMHGPVDFVDYSLALLNGFLVFCTVGGATAVGGGSSTGIVDRGDGKRGFFTPWF
jgi:hypothetical protein